MGRTWKQGTWRMQLGVGRAIRATSTLCWQWFFLEGSLVGRGVLARVGPADFCLRAKVLRRLDS